MSDPVTRLTEALSDRYRIERELGEGGMATVYLADDLKHNRKVAIKVLKPELAAVVGAERFLAEIETTAGLQHPHILPLFDSGEAGGFLYYVMPYVDGESLRDRLDREKQLPVEEAVALAVRVAAALQAAHDRGVVHRDVKPANILLQNGEPLVADFGIALAVSQAGAGRLTETGLSLGTPYYMAPEQAMADRDPDQRSDLYSLACVTYEMLAGDPPFRASTAQGVLGKILTGAREPLEQRRPTTPAHVAAAVDQALERLPADRFGTVREFAVALNDPGFTSRASGARTSGSGAIASRLQERGRLKRQLTLGAIGLVMVAVALAGWLRPGASPGASGLAPVTESRIYTPPQVRVELWTEFALSPSGDRLLFTGRDSAGVSRIWMRPVAGEAVAPLPGTENGAFPFWAPDGRAVGFTSRGALRVLELETGRVRVLCDVDAPNPATWTDDDAIYFTHLNTIHRTGPDGEACERITDPNEGGSSHRWPTVLPGGEIVYSSRYETAGLWVVQPGGSPTLLVEGGWNATFVPPDWLVYHDFPTAEGDVPLLARRIDVESREFLSPPAPVFDSIWTPNGTARYSVSNTGVLVAARAPADDHFSELVWVDRSGEVQDRVPLGWTSDASSRGRRVAVGGWGLWVWDPSRGTSQQLPPGLGVRRIIQQPAWSPGDSLLAFAAFLSGPEGLFTYRLRDGQMDTLRTGRVDDVAWTPGGDTVVYRMGAGQERPEAEVRFHVRSSGHDERLFAAPATDPIWQTLEVSPDGRWLLYSSTVSGVDDLYVRTWPELDAPRRVSSAGGLQGRWSEGGDTIFYRTGVHELMAVPFGADGPGSLGVPRSLGGSDDLFEFWGLDGESGQFLRRERLEGDRAPPIRLVTNWIARAEGRMP